MPQHPRVQEILVYRSELILQNFIEMLDDYRVAMH
jgi:hypothetical protein